MAVTGDRHTIVGGGLEGPRRSRTRYYTIGVVIFVVATVGGFLGFRAYVYGDDAPPLPIIGNLGD